MEQATLEQGQPEPSGALAVREETPEGALVTREEFAAIQTAEIAETASTAVAAMARARVEAQYVMALKRPRDWDDVRSRFLKECRRPSFAEVALYNKPIGRGIEGPSIRMAEAAIRCMGNTDSAPEILYDDDIKRIVRFTVTDLEANNTESRVILLSKTVERSKPEDDGTFLSVRKNSRGNNVYTVHATEDDLLVKQEALVSKAKRTCSFRLFPGDILEEGIQIVKETLKNRAAADPDLERKRIADAFAAQGIMPSDLKTLLGHELGQCSPAELVELRKVWAGIKDGEIAWKDLIAERGKEASEGPSKTERLRDKVKATAGA